MGEIKIKGIICKKCGRDLTKFVALLGNDVVNWHMSLHERNELVQENKDLKERVGELEEELMLYIDSHPV